MKVAASMFLVLIAAGSAAAQPPRPQACRYVVDVKNKEVAATTQDKVACEFAGKILMTVNNLDDAKYRLEIRNFKFDSTDPSKCAAPTTAATTPINDSDGGAFKFNLNEESTHTKKKQVKALGARAAECFKFDIWLYNQGGTVPIHKLDPEIQITEPQPPPPVKKPNGE